jgi:hypothetical protein
MNYTVKKQPTGYDFDVQYILEDETGAFVLSMKGELLTNLYRNYAKDKEDAKSILNSTYNEPSMPPPVPKEAIDYFVEETYNK